MSVDLSTRYLGIPIEHPIVASAGPATSGVDALCRLEDAGVAAAVLPSLFEEQITHEEHQLAMLYDHQADSFAEALSYFPEVELTESGPEDYLRKLTEAKSAVSFPIIASLNGASPGGWTRYAKRMQDAGADAIELNVYFVATDPEMTALDVEDRYVDLVASVRESVSVPLAVKIGTRFSCIPNFAQKLAAAGADGLVLFNRYRSPDIDLQTLQVKPEVVLSRADELRLPLRWIGILRDQLSISLAASTGVHTAADVIKALLVGADVAMMTSALIRSGVGCIPQIVAGVSLWLEENEYASVEQIKGSMSMANCPDSSAFARANYMATLVNYSMPAG